VESSLSLTPEEPYPTPEEPYLIASGGWCAPSDQIFDIFNLPGVPHVSSAHCPDWNIPDDSWCEARSAWEPDTYTRAWHSCKYEYAEPHTLCVCEDCGATRIITQEGTPWQESGSPQEGASGSMSISPSTSDAP
jgi:hypothetical protein